MYGNMLSGIIEYRVGASCKGGEENDNISSFKLIAYGLYVINHPARLYKIV